MRGGCFRGTIGGMYRPRIQVPGGYYHVGTRGNDRQRIFDDDYDRIAFLLQLRRASRRYGWTILAYCLMTNHYHLVLQLSDRGLSRGMCELNGGYAASYNVRHRRSNHVFGRRFWDDSIDGDGHLYESCRYVVLNPVRAGFRDDPAAWPWSSYRACAGLEHAPGYLAAGELLEHFGADPVHAQRVYRSFVRDGRGQRQPPWQKCDESVT
jgi:REP element-mobilizing transposase RayT